MFVPFGPRVRSWLSLPVACTRRSSIGSPSRVVIGSLLFVVAAGCAEGRAAVVSDSGVVAPSSDGAVVSPDAWQPEADAAPPDAGVEPRYVDYVEARVSPDSADRSRTTFWIESRAADGASRVQVEAELVDGCRVIRDVEHPTEPRALEGWTDVSRANGDSVYRQNILSPVTNGASREALTVGERIQLRFRGIGTHPLPEIDAVVTVPPPLEGLRGLDRESFSRSEGIGLRWPVPVEAGDALLAVRLATRSADGGAELRCTFPLADGIALVTPRALAELGPEMRVSYAASTASEVELASDEVHAFFGAYDIVTNGAGDRVRGHLTLDP